MPDIDPRPTLDAPDDDPHIWLEEIEGQAPLAWIEEQNARTLARFAGRRFEADRDALAAIFDRRDNIPYVQRRAGLLYNFWQDAEHPRGLWRRTTLEEFRRTRRNGRCCSISMQLAGAENEDWVWKMSATLPPDHERAILYFSRGGSDASVLREFDLTQKRFVEDGFTLPEAKGGASWLDADTLLLPAPMAARTADHLGLCAALCGFGGAAPIRRRAGAVRGPTRERFHLCGPRPHGQNRARAVQRSVSASSRSISGSETAPARRSRSMCRRMQDLSFHDEWFVLKTRTAWTLGDTTYAPDTLVAGSVADLLAGSPRVQVLFQASERVTLQDFSWVQWQVARLDPRQSAAAL